MANPTYERVSSLYDMPLLDLVFQAAEVHQKEHGHEKIQGASLLSIKTGACPEDCGYCAQSGHHATDLEREKLLDKKIVTEKARRAQESGADRFCMGAAWRKVQEGKQFDQVLEMIREVKSLGLETCATLGMLTAKQANSLAKAGLDYYNHNIDTSREYYPQVVSTRTYDDRLDTLAVARKAGLKLCCGGILGLGEEIEDRKSFIAELAMQNPPPESVPINVLVPVAGTPLENAPPIPWDELVRTVAVARILMPTSYVRLSAGRESLTEECQALCFMAGANSIFLGEQLLTTPNRNKNDDLTLLQKLGLQLQQQPNPATQGISV